MSNKHLPPWRDRLPDGTMGPEYGPTVSTYVRQVARHADWSYRPAHVRREVNGAEMLREFMCMSDGTLRSDGVAMSEFRTYTLIFVHGLGLKTAAAQMGVTRSTVRKNLMRLRDKARKAKGKPDALDTEAHTGAP